jgi:glycosyltransferase involved in cell wall biosynthesis
MKIMYIATGSGLNDGVGGSNIRSVEIAKKLAKSGHEICFLTTIGCYKAYKNKNISWYLLPASIFKKKEKYFFDRLFSYIISTVSSFWIVPKLPKYDLIYTDSDYFCDVIPAMLYKKTHKSSWVAMTHHKTKVTYKKPRDLIVSSATSTLQSFCYLQFKKYADKIFVYKSDMGQLITNHLISIGVPSSKIETVSNGVNLEFINSIQKENKIYDACFIGGLRPSKGIYHIVPIWKKVVEKKKDALLIIVGGGLKDYEDELSSQINKEGLESNIKMLGAKNHDETLNILAKSKIFFSPSNEEGWGIAICEALAFGLPVVAWDLPVYRTLYPKGVVKAPIGDVQQFSEHVLDLLADKNHYKEVSKDSRQIVSAYDWNDIAIRETRLFQTILKDQLEEKGL